MPKLKYQNPPPLKSSLTKGTNLCVKDEIKFLYTEKEKLNSAL
jgi:hypothetical protein